MGLRLFAVAMLDGLHGESPAAGTRLVPVREVAAVVEEAAFQLPIPDEALASRHHEVVSAVFTHSAGLLPAPAGTVFRDQRALEQWLELHYVAIHDALAFVEDRVEGRVHVRRTEGAPDERDMGAEVAATAAECFRVFRRQAVVSVPLRSEHATGIAVSSAYLVERSLWKEFASLVEEERDRHAGVRVSVTGPWPPYDFVRINFGG